MPQGENPTPLEGKGGRKGFLKREKHSLRIDSGSLGRGDLKPGDRGGGKGNAILHGEGWYRVKNLWSY